MPSTRSIALVLAALAATLALASAAPAAPDAGPDGGLEAPTLTRWPMPMGVPVALAPLPDGSLLVASQTDGRIFRVAADGTPGAAPVITLPSSPPVGEFGLLGLDLHPDFPATPLVYALYTERPEIPEIRFQRIVRFTFDMATDAAGEPEDVVTGLPTGWVCCHNGGRIRFGPDGMLYATLGDNMIAPLSQVPYHPAGSVLRYTPDGDVPADNPFPLSPVAVTGLRNPFGLAFDHAWGMVVTDNGPSVFDGPSGLDEVNLLAVGDNAGWPLARGDVVVPGTVAPLWHSGSSSIAPTGVLVPRGSAVSEWDGKVLWCNFVGGGARLIDPAVASPQPTIVFSPCHYDVVQDALGRIVFATNGALWVAS